MFISKAERARLIRHATMDVIMARVPEVIPVLFKNKMHCVGCLLAPFHDLADAAFEHGLDEDILIEEFQNAVPEASSS